MPNHNSKIPEMISCLFWPFIFYLSLWHLQTFLIYALKQGRLNNIIDLRVRQFRLNAWVRWAIARGPTSIGAHANLCMFCMAYVF
jgi:hypothetical protein